MKEYVSKVMMLFKAFLFELGLVQFAINKTKSYLNEKKNKKKIVT